MVNTVINELTLITEYGNAKRDQAENQQYRGSLFSIEKKAEDFLHSVAHFNTSF